MNEFALRHLGPDAAELTKMLDSIQTTSLESLIDQTIPAKIRLQKPLNLPPAATETEIIQELKEIFSHNKLYQSYIGQGYYPCILPSVIQRNVLENPSWYTQYTPYQAEISQGRLEALFIFQTMISDLTGFPIANASLLDEGTAAAEAMTMLLRCQKGKPVRNKFFVSKNCFPQTIEVIKTRALPLNIEIIIDDEQQTCIDETFFGAILQYPHANGNLIDDQQLIQKLHDQKVRVIMAVDLLSLTILKAPAELGADVAIGTAQRFGEPMGAGGPHAAYLATKDEFKRQIPGRIIGLSIDTTGKPAYRMALGTREQHIKREKATSNICTAQALLAIISAFYTVYHGPKGLKQIATRIQYLAQILAKALKELGYQQTNEHFFDTLQIQVTNQKNIKNLAEAQQINFNYHDHQSVGITLSETTTMHDLKKIVQVFAEAAKQNQPTLQDIQTLNLPETLQRQSTYLTQKVFNQYHSETKMLRFIKTLEVKDLSLANAMIPLGSCTMKLNPTTTMLPITWPEVAELHPFAPENQLQGYQIFNEKLKDFLCEITGFENCSLQPNSGAQGEYAGLLTIRNYYQSIGENHRQIMLIPSSAHGTNPASATMAGMQIIVIKCDENGNVDMQDLKQQTETHRENLAGIMVTYPSTHGVFEESIVELCDLIHECGGQVYMDGANMNAQVGLTSPGFIGADVCHLNLHKTFGMPHGGGGPGVGPICVKKHLIPFVPETGASAPNGSASIYPIAYAFIRLLGEKGLTLSTQYAILNANYIKARLEKFYPVLYTGKNDRVAHELIIDFHPFIKHGIEVEDVAKRLMDYSFHSPTMSFPVPGTLMIEPTESEDLGEIDRFCEALIQIYQEIQEVAAGKTDAHDNVLKNAPHPISVITDTNWKHAYSREQAVYPVENLRDNKFWPTTTRIDNTYGDRNLICKIEN